MPDVVKHAWTHRPREEGGTDPIPVAGAAGQWCRLGITTDQTVTAGSDTILEWDLVANPYPDYYDVVEAQPGTTSTTTAIDILQNGTYVLTYALYIDQAPTNKGMFVEINRVNWTTDAAIHYHPIHELANYPMNTMSVAGSHGFRSGAAYGAVFLTAINAAAADASIIFLGDDLNITYMEIMRVAPAPFVGNPYGFLGGT